MTGAPIRVFIDYISPYAYIAWHQLKPLAARHGRALEPAPVLLAAMLNAHGNLGPAEVPAKRAYVFKDAYRKAHMAGLPPLTPPPAHPFNPLTALRITHAVEDRAAQARLIDAIFAAVWTGVGIEAPGALEAAIEAAGLDAAALLARAADAEVKDRLRRATDEAIAAGAFGVPTFCDDLGELFWGVDALQAFDAYLAGHDPVPADLVTRWATLPASAQRPR
jgi:2-hydroxychromene-2-carboxylate isomerase